VSFEIFPLFSKNINQNFINIYKTIEINSMSKMIAILILLCLCVSATAFVPSAKVFRGIQKTSLNVALDPKGRDESKLELPPKQRVSRKVREDAAKEDGRLFGFSKNAEVNNFNNPPELMCT
jgi:hypothetical protein